MSPVRIVILIALFYILFRLLAGAGRREKKGQAPRTDSGRMPAQDVLKEDPVCHTLIPARRAVTLRQNGKTVYFCSESCRTQFTTNQGEKR